MWRTFAADRVTLSEGGAVATQTVSGQSLTTTGTEITEGKHYWEVELLSEKENGIFIGISRPNLNPVGEYFNRESGWFTHVNSGKRGDDRAGKYKQGDRVSVLLDLDNGSLRFFKNGVQHGPGYPAGSVVGPVVHAVQFSIPVRFASSESIVRLLRDAAWPTGHAQ